jgi:hypothetical protein
MEYKSSLSCSQEPTTTVSWARWIKFTRSKTIFLRSILYYIPIYADVFQVASSLQAY